MNENNIELLRPFSNDGISTYAVLFRSNKKWGFIRSKDGCLSLPWYSCPESSCNSTVENALMGIVFRATGAFEFDAKPIFDLEMNDNGKKLFGRIYVVELYSPPVKNELSFLGSGEITDDVNNVEFVRELLSSADVIANIYF